MRFHHGRDVAPFPVFVRLRHVKTTTNASRAHRSLGHVVSTFSEMQAMHDRWPTGSSTTRRRMDGCVSLSFASTDADARCVVDHVRRKEGIVHVVGRQVGLDDVITRRPLPLPGTCASAHVPNSRLPRPRVSSTSISRRTCLRGCALRFHVQLSSLVATFPVDRDLVSFPPMFTIEFTEGRGGGLAPKPTDSKRWEATRRRRRWRTWTWTC